MYDYIHLNKKGVQLFARVLRKQLPATKKCPSSSSKNQTGLDPWSAITELRRSSPTATEPCSRRTQSDKTPAQHHLLQTCQIMDKSNIYTNFTVSMKSFRISCCNIQGLHSSTFGNKTADQDLISNIKDIDIVIFHETWCWSNETLHCPRGYREITVPSQKKKKNVVVIQVAYLYGTKII